MVKKLDQLIIKSFIPPFIIAYSIAAFVLLMQVLWLYIDDIAGKGLSPWLIIELLFYRSMSIVPLALPLGMLIASVMTMGNLAERYELSSMKSAGVSLWRVMRSILLYGLLIALFSAYCSNTLIPISNLKFGSRMFDIQQKKPTLQMETGTFNYDFQGYAIHFKEKAKNGREIKDVLIYDHSSFRTGEVLQIVAERGEMFTSPDGKYFVMRLQNGYQYMEQRPRSSRQDSKYPFVRVKFDTWRKIFDLGEFELSRTNPELFNKNRQMMTTSQLMVAIDSIEIRIHRRIVEISNYTSGYFHYEELDSTYLEPASMDVTDIKGTPVEDTLSNQMKETIKKNTPKASELNVKPSVKKSSSVKNIALDGKKEKFKPKKKVKKESGGKILKQKLEAPVEDYESLLATFGIEDQRSIKTKSKTTMRSVLNQAQSAVRSVDRMMVSRVKHIYDMHMKYSMALVCLIFVFIGAPMGAIVRKGGFGYPILISIIFFILFVVLMIFCRKFAESFRLDAVAAAWIPCAILLPIGIFLTIKAMQDSKLTKITFFSKWIGLLVRLFKRKEKQKNGVLDQEL